MQVGDEVTWTYTERFNGGYAFSKRKGKIIKIEGESINIKHENGIIELKREHIRNIGEELELIESAIKSSMGGTL